MQDQILPSAEPILAGPALFEALPGNSVLIRPHGAKFVVLAATPGYLDVSKAAGTKLLGQDFFATLFLRPDCSVAQKIEASFREVLLHKRSDAIQVRLDCDGTETLSIWTINNKPVIGSDGTVDYIVHTIEVQQLQAAAPASEAKSLTEAHQLFQNAPVIIGVLKGDAYIIELANEGLLEVWGRSSEVIGKPLLEAIPELEAQGFISLLDGVRASGGSFHAYEFPITLVRDGKEEELYFDFVYKPLYDKGHQGKASGIISVGHEVTKQVLAKKKLSESEARYRALLETMNQGFCVLEVLFDKDETAIDFRYLEINAAFERQSGLTEARGKRILELAPGFETHWFKAYGDVVKTGQPIRYIEESKALGKWFDVYAFPIGPPGSSTMAAFFTDITEQKTSEQEIRESEERFRKLADDSPMFVFIVDADPAAPVRYWNKTWLQYTGQSLEEAIGRAWNGIIHPEDIAIVMQHYVPAFKNKADYLIPAVRVKRQDGAYRWHAFKGNPRYAAAGEFDGYVGVGFDIHEQKLAEEALQQSEARSRLAIESARLGTYDLDLLQNTIIYSPRTGEIFGFEPGSHMPYAAFKDAVYPEDKTVKDKAHAKAAVTGELFYEVRIKTPLQPLKWIRLNGKYQYQGGERRSIVGTVMDITEERKTAELLEQRIEERTSELKQVNDQLKQFSYSASHDLQEPLRKISFFLNTLVGNIGPTLGDENKKIVDRIQHTTGRMRGLIDDLLAYSNTTLGITGFLEVDLGEVVTGVLDDMEAVILGQKAKVTVADLPLLPGDERQLRQLFQNLLSNALKYGKKNTPPEVHMLCRQVNGESMHPDFSQTIRHETFYEIRVQDNGIGFDPDDAEKIFRIFHRLHGKGEYEGTGVGLAIVQKVVENHKGYIWAESSPGEGATFVVLLPLSQ